MRSMKTNYFTEKSFKTTSKAEMRQETNFDQKQKN